MNIIARFLGYIASLPVAFFAMVQLAMAKVAEPWLLVVACWISMSVMFYVICLPLLRKEHADDSSGADRAGIFLSAGVGYVSYELTKIFVLFALKHVN